MSLSFAASMLSLGLMLAPARLTQPQGRAPKPLHGLQAPKLWQDRGGLFALQRPENERWMFRAGVRGPGGELVPLLALSQETGAQLVVQSADGIHDLRMLARILMENLGNEERVHVEDLVPMVARGGDAYAFGFSAADEVRGRVAVVRAGERVALVIASWPMAAPPEVVEDVEAMIGSLGPVPGALPPGAFQGAAFGSWASGRDGWASGLRPQASGSAELQHHGRELIVERQQIFRQSSAVGADRLQIAADGGAGERKSGRMRAQLFQCAEGEREEGGAGLRLRGAGRSAESADGFGEERDLAPRRQHGSGVIEGARAIAGRDRLHAEPARQRGKLLARSRVRSRNAGRRSTEIMALPAHECAQRMERPDPRALAPHGPQRVQRERAGEVRHQLPRPHLDQLAHRRDRGVVHRQEDHVHVEERRRREAARSLPRCQHLHPRFGELLEQRLADGAPAQHGRGAQRPHLSRLRRAPGRPTARI